MLSCRRRVEWNPCSDCCDLAIEGVLSAGRWRPARTPFGGLGRVLPVVAPASKCGVCCLPLVGPRVCGLVNGTRDIPVEALFPQCGERFELGSSRSSRVLGIDAVGGPPHCNFANEGGARVTSRVTAERGRPVTGSGAMFDIGGRRSRPGSRRAPTTGSSGSDMSGFVEKRTTGRWRARYRGPDGRERSKTFDRRVDADRWLAGCPSRSRAGNGLTLLVLG
jgi:hypothetical protein